MSDSGPSSAELGIDLSEEQDPKKTTTPPVEAPIPSTKVAISDKLDDPKSDSAIESWSKPILVEKDGMTRWEFPKGQVGADQLGVEPDTKYIIEGGIAFMVDIKTGKKVALIGGGAGGVKEPDPADLGSQEAFRDWAENQLRPFERLSNRVIDPAYMRDLLSTIAAAKVPASQILSSDDFKKELMRRVRARIRYHNASVKASLGLDGFGAEFNDIQRDEHIEIFQAQGVREAVEQLIATNGAFFRLETAAADTRRTAIRGFLEAGVFAGIADANKKREAAALALELAEKTAHIFGVSAYYDGIRTAGDVFEEPPPGILNAIPNESAGVRSRRILDWYQNWFEQNYDNIDFDRSFKGQGAGHMRNIFYTPIRLRKEGEGEIDFLRRYAYIRMTDAVHYLEQDSLLALMDRVTNVNMPGLRLSDWGASVTAAHTARKALFEKENSVLNIPLVDPDGVRTENTSSTLPKALENYRKAQEAYAHLSSSERKRAMAHILKGILFYINNRNATAADGFTWNGWNQKIMLDTLIWAERERVISRDEVLAVERDLRTSRNIAALQAASPELRKGLFAGIGAFFKAISSGK